jgi:hypothetical protein
MPITARQLVIGEKFTISELVRQGRSLFREFFDSLTKQQQAKVLRILERIADHGPPRNEEKFVHEEDGIYAIKDFKVRIYCFYDRESLILLTHGAIKKGNKAKPEDLRRAKRLRGEYVRKR